MPSMVVRTAAGSFEFPVGNYVHYSPLVTNVTSVTGPSSLTVSVTDATHPQAQFPELALERYWTLTESGDITADLIFHYLQDDYRPM